ncbi:hypothetical protein MVI27_08520 [Chryseobacterium salipaludis]|uniref:hypothetical protein n=1 Tax=Chryseobacterium TaxID=59732 RepID=UPI001FF6DDB9|nr:MULTISPECIES: hypothetical protein [Chryseobacterium]MCJ8498303.1 hypothetical protein [Chryseobacterium salipaludis]MCX3297451.1 hypothetical protein [Planobacterium sp. JC490]
MNKIQLKEKASISDIAKDLGLDLATLIEFHNANSQPHEWIRRDFTVASWVNELLIPDTVENLKEKKLQQEFPHFVNLDQKEFEERYKILQKIDLSVAGNSLVDSETNIIWKLKKLKKYKYFTVNVQQEQHEVNYIKSMYRQLAEYMQKFNRPLEILVLALNSDGSINSILNQEEIKMEWDILRSELASEMIGTLEEKNMLDNGEQDFTDTLPLLKNNFLYNLFFKELFQEYHEVGKFVEIPSHTYISQIFSNEKVNLITKRKVEKEGDIIKIKFYSESKNNLNQHLKRIYDSNLKDFLREDFNYLLNWSLEYHFNKEGKLLFCQSKTKEQATNQYSHIMEHIINIV